MSQKIFNRYIDLINESHQIKDKARKVTNSEYDLNYLVLDEDEERKYLEWKIKTKNLLRLSCGENSVHYSEFLSLEGNQHDNKYTLLISLMPVLRAAFDDLQNGFLISFKQIVQADVFDSELEQAKSLLNNGYKNAAAVIAGTVLETAVKELCLNHGIDLDRKKLTHLNDELAKLGIYNKLQQKQITALADIRNNAAHGEYEQFNQDHVVRMIEDIERFLLTYSS